MTVEEKKIEQEPDAVEAARATKPLLSVKNLNFSYDPKATKKDIVGLDCLVQPNSKVILIGANGAGKSTLLRILTGMLWGADVEYDEFDVNGREKVNDQVNGIAYLGERWKRRRTGFEGVCPYTLDTAPTEMFVKWQKDHSARRDELVEVLGVNLDWRLNECSDGQRKKVRLLFKLLKPFKLAIIDEFAADLDIFSRQRFFAYLTKECAERGASVIFATHIFDQVDLWATHVTFMQLDGTLSPIHPLHTLPAYQEILARSGNERAMCPMYTLIVEEMERQYKQENVILADVEQTPTAPTLENGNDEVDAMGGRECQTTTQSYCGQKSQFLVHQRQTHHYGIEFHCSSELQGSAGGCQWQWQKYFDSDVDRTNLDRHGV